MTDGPFGESEIVQALTRFALLVWLYQQTVSVMDLALTYGWLVGTGPGAGIALMFVGTSLLGAALCFAGYLIPAVRNIEEALADHTYGPGAGEVQPA
ncbi:MAG: hypothetical protein DYG89_45910 [Caldilinea sp. CFX5]|nr:hypothetical protein [Caldilinea sp. CFX5]